MAYIIENDIRNLLLQRDVDIILEVATGEDGQDYLNQWSIFAIEFVKSKIQHRYDPDQIFIDANIFDNTDTYALDDLIYYEVDAWVLGTAYTSGNRVSYENFVYENILATSTELPTNATNWGKKVRNKQYFKNILEGSGVLPEVTASWTLGDTRNPLILRYTVVITSYELFKKAQPNMIPDWVISSRDEAVESLNRIARGLDTVLLPLYKDVDGNPDDTIGQEITSGNEYNTQNYDF